MDDLERTPPRAESDEARSYLQDHRVSTIVLVASVVIGAVVGYSLLGDQLSAPRRVVGGGLGGFGCWLLVMMGRALD